LRRFSKKKIPGVKEEDLSPFLFHPGDHGGLLGDTAKRISESPTRLDLTHHIVCINNGELNPGCTRGRKGMEKKNHSKSQQGNVSNLHRSPPFLSFLTDQR
jgi:hypothetical protein